MSTQGNVQTVKIFFAAMGQGDKPGLLALSAEDIDTQALAQSSEMA